MPVKSVANLPVEGTRVFLRVDYNVPLTPAGGVADDARIRATLPTVRHLLARGARLIIASHLGRPGGKPDAAASLEPVGARLAELLGQDVVLADEPVGDGARKVVSDLRDGQIALLENLRFHPGEEANDDGFARQLASYADVYVSDAFGAAHRAHASTVGMTKHVGVRGAGFLLLAEIDFLSRLLGTVERPFVAVIGGAKVSDKLGVLESLLGRVDKMLIGGAMANTFLRAQGHELGRSKLEAEKLALARSFLKKAGDQNVAVVLPSDLVVATSLDDDAPRVVPVGGVGPADLALDIGPATTRAFEDELARARTIFWNGPMGLFERAAFAEGTFRVARAIGANRRALTVAGGGDSALAIEQAGLVGKLSHLSTGGGASLEFIEGNGKPLPGIAALETEETR
ncbi:MAG: phosphoglycerate kinase [Myxococcales bacterium]|nr:phosphoglycerate kinase [Myxococcales bacterium]